MNSSAQALLLLLPGMVEAGMVGGVLETSASSERGIVNDLDRLNRRLEKAGPARRKRIEYFIRVREKNIVDARRQHDFFKRWLPVTTVAVVAFYVVVGAVWLWG